MTQYQGEVAINGESNCGFLLSAIEGQLPGGEGQDKLRMKVWDTFTGQVVYDNQMDADDSANPTTALGGGSIAIHRG